MISCDIVSTREIDNTSTAEKSETANYSQWGFLQTDTFQRFEKEGKKMYIYRLGPHSRSGNEDFKTLIQISISPIIL